MTIEELKLRLKRAVSEDGGLIRCRDVRQRAEVLQFLTDIGFVISPSTKEWLRGNPRSTQFMHPGLTGKQTITVWNTLISDYISFEDIEDLIAKVNTTPLDERSDEEFSKAFEELYS